MLGHRHRLARRLATVALAAGTPALACCRPAPARVVCDLAALAPVTALEGPRLFLAMGTPAARWSEGEGFALPAEGVSDHLLVRRTSSFFIGALREPAVALVDLSPLTGTGGQAVEVTLDGARVGRFTLGSARERHAVPLPAAAPGQASSTLGLAFERVVPPSVTGIGRMAARLHGLALLDPADPTLASATLPGAPPLAAALPGPTSGIVQVGGTWLRFVLDLPAGTRLRFSPRAHRSPTVGSPGLARLRVAAQAQGQPERELWTGVVDGREAGPAELDLPLPGPGLVRLGLGVDAGARAWAEWSAPRVVGASGPDPLFQDPASGLPPEPDRAAARARNVVLMILDAASARHVGAYGYHRDTTPELDRLAREGVLFEQAHTPAVYTLLAMSAVWTSQYPHQTRWNARLSADAPTLAELLESRGVRCGGFVGNAQAGHAFGLDRGFSVFEEVYATPPGGTRAFRQALPRFLAAHRDRPFFLYAHVPDPHFPYAPEPPFDTVFGPDGPITQEQRRDPGWLKKVSDGDVVLDQAGWDHLARLYDGNLRVADRAVGDLRHDLEALGLWEDTALVVTADHGESLGERGTVGHQAEVHREVTHVPLVMRLPGGPRGKRVPGLVDLTDLAPTFADLLGVREADLPRSFQGRSLLPLASGAGGGRAFVVSRNPGLYPRYALRHGRWTCHFATRRGTRRLYDVEKDPREREDLAARDPWRAEYERLGLHRFVLSLRRPGRAPETEAELDEEQQENLRALGYVE